MADMFQVARCDLLRSHLADLTSRDREFAESLLDQFTARGLLSEKQWFWVDTLIDRAQHPAEKQIETVGEMAGVMALFAKAELHLKHPAIVLMVPGVGEVRLSVAGERAAVPGSVNVASNDGWDDRTWFGRIHQDGQFEHGRRAPAPAPLVAKLREFAARPAEVAAEHGRLTGRCCFCNTGLTDERSTAVGYGPTCAKNWGLPWGGRPRDERRDLFTCAAE